MRKGELARLREVVEVQQSQIEAWRGTAGMMIRMWEDEVARTKRLVKELELARADVADLLKEIEVLASACKSTSRPRS